MRTKLPFAGVQGGHQGKGHFDLSSGPGLRLHLPGGPKHATLGLVATFERSSGFGADMNPNLADIGYAIEVFVRGHSAKKSQTFPYEASRVGPLWVMRDAPRRNHSDYRKEEWIAHGIAATEADAIARRQSRGRFFVCPIIGKDEPEEPVRSAYKSLGYRLLATEAFFVQPLTQIPAPDASVQIERVRSPERAAQLGKATRTRPIADHLLLEDAPFRQYVALDDGEIVGQVRSIDAAGATWCADMHVSEAYRRRGIGRALLCRMLQDDKSHYSKGSYLLASHAGALLYPHVKYDLIGKLFIFAPAKSGK